MKNSEANQASEANVYYNYEGALNMNENNTLPKLLSAKEVAAILKIGYVKALELMKYGKIPAVKLGNTYRTSETALNKWLSEQFSQ